MCRGWQAVTLDHVTSWYECLIKQVRVCGPGYSAAVTERAVRQINSAMVAHDTNGQLASQYACIQLSPAEFIPTSFHISFLIAFCYVCSSLRSARSRR